jgi:hypothetical protein
MTNDQFSMRESCVNHLRNSKPETRNSKLLLPVLLAALASCGPAINSHAKNSFLTDTDLTTMTQQMASAIASDPKIAALTAQHPITIVLTHVENRTAEIIPSPGKDIFLARIRGLLSNQPELRARFAFVLNKQSFELLKTQEGTVGDLGPDADRLVPEYALKATFYTLTSADEKRRSDYYLCSFQLTNIASGEQLWQGQYETKKSVAKGFLD